jgi:hypothetical protein
MKWNCGIPGVVGTDWEGGVYKVTMEFTDEVSLTLFVCSLVKHLIKFLTIFNACILARAEI